MIGIYDDLRYGLRAPGKNPGFTAACIVSLALGIGANTTILSLVNAVLLRPVPVWDPGSLAAIYAVDSGNPGFWGCSYPVRQGHDLRALAEAKLAAGPRVRASDGVRGGPRGSIRWWRCGRNRRAA